MQSAAPPRRAGGGGGAGGRHPSPTVQLWSTVRSPIGDLHGAEHEKPTRFA